MVGVPPAVDNELASVFILFVVAGLILLAHGVQVLRWRKAMQAPFTASALPPAPHIELTVVLPVRNEADTLPHLLSDLAQQNHLPSEVLVIDDASDDGTPNVVERRAFPFSIRLLANPGRGKKAGLSAGIREAASDWVVQVDADTRVGPDALAAVAADIGRRTEQDDPLDMALLPLRLARDAQGPSRSRFDRLQALDFAAMQGWAIAAVDRKQAAMASGGGWVWRAAAFPHDQLRPDLPSGDDVFSLTALIERGDQARVGRIPDRAAMVSARPMATLPELVHQRVRWGAKSVHYPQALSEARRVAWTVALVHAAGLALLVGSPWVGLGFWTAKSAVDMAYTARVGRAYQLFSGGQRCRSTDLICLAVLHPVFIATTLLLMPFQTARWKGRPAT